MTSDCLFIDYVSMNFKVQFSWARVSNAILAFWRQRNWTPYLQQENHCCFFPPKAPIPPNPSRHPEMDCVLWAHPRYRQRSSLNFTANLQGQLLVTDTTSLGRWWVGGWMCGRMGRWMGRWWGCVCIYIYRHSKMWQDGFAIKIRKIPIFKIFR